MIVRPSKAPFFFSTKINRLRIRFFVAGLRSISRVDTDFEKSIRIGGPGML